MGKKYDAAERRLDAFALCLERIKFSVRAVRQIVSGEMDDNKRLESAHGVLDLVEQEIDRLQCNLAGIEAVVDEAHDVRPAAAA